MKLMETEHIELKRTVTPALLKEIIAFANSGGGAIYIGIDDDSQVIGVTDADAVILQIENMIRNTIKPDITLFVKLTRKRLQKKEIIIIEVNQGNNRPYYLATKGMRPVGVFVRRGTATEQASAEAIRQMIKDTDGDTFENMRSFNQNLTFESATAVFKQQGLTFGAAQQKTLGLTNDNLQYTNLGLLLSDECQHSIKAVLFQGLNQTTFLNRKEFTGSLFTQMNDAYQFIDEHNQIHSDFRGLKRIDRRDYPEVALREALLNCIVHRDYGHSSSTLIGIYDDRMEFTNIGGLPQGLTLQDAMIGYSECRNPQLANVFFRLEFIEAYGTGLRKILQAYNGYTKQPEFIVTENIFKVVLPNINYQTTEKAGMLSDREVAYSRQEYLTRKQLQAELGVSQATAVRIIRQRLDDGELQAIGKGKNIKYRVIR